VEPDVSGVPSVSFFDMARDGRLRLEPPMFLEDLDAADMVCLFIVSFVSQLEVIYLSNISCYLRL
jgi:hypothetical protein